MNLLAIDPGKFHAGSAVFVEGRLFSARTFKARSKNPASAAREISLKVQEQVGEVTLNHVCCELPNVRARIRQKGDPNDLLFLMLTNGAVLSRVVAEEYELVEVNRWKGSVPKEIMKGRITGDWGGRPAPNPSRLDEGELRVLGNRPGHNTIDAVGIGLWKLRRL